MLSAAPPKGGDRFPGARAELVGAHGQRLGQLPVPQYLYAITDAVYHPGREQRFRGDDGVRLECLQIAQVDDRVVRLERFGLEPARGLADAALLGQAPVQRV
jgi:hypothetical protein